MKNLITVSLVALYSISAHAEIQNVDFSLDLKSAAAKEFTVTAAIDGIDSSSLTLKLPKWMPGYYQLMDYRDDISDFTVTDAQGKALNVRQNSDGSWQLDSLKTASIRVSYKLKTHTKFVANNFVESDFAYIVPTNTFIYVDGYKNIPATVSLDLPDTWNEKVATGLTQIGSDSFSASDFDVLYDSPLLAGELQSTEPFKVKGVEHEFIGYQLGDFDEQRLMSSLQKAITKATDIFGDVPYDHYTFLSIGPGRGGIEHLNSSSVTFDGNNLKSKEEYDRVLSFLTHEYFHHFNVKRIRPFELGPFNYDKPTRTTQMWVNEGLTVYYEYLVLNRAGLADQATLFGFLEKDINAFESDNGKTYQSLLQSSYYTWEDGPFGVQGGEDDRSISFYNKGAVVGFLLDLAIRQATSNQKSLDNVMYRMYWEFYKAKNRGFTDAEFMQVCEEEAGTQLAEVFEYVSTTKPLNYEKYLGYAGLELIEGDEGKLKIKIKSDRTASQKTLFEAWIAKH